jgi:hypothetical protein
MVREPHARLVEALAAIARARRRASRTAFLRRSVREPLSWFLLWTLTATVGLTLAAVGISGLTGHPHGDWHVPAAILRDMRPRQYEDVYDSVRGWIVRRPKKVVALMLHVPSPSSAALGVTGLVACLAGFSRRRISALALLSTALLLASLVGPILVVVAAQSFYWVLDALT